MEEPASSSGGVSTITASLGPATGDVARALSAKEAWLAIRRPKPRLGAGYTALRTTRTPSWCSVVQGRFR